MAGGLLALDRAGANFQLISMAGGGSVVGLIYLAPRNMTRQEGLQNTVNCGVSDPIYASFPVNYKLFNKPGHMAALYREAMRQSCWIGPLLDQRHMNNGQKLFSDWVQFQAAVMSPSSTTYYSKGLCAHAPFIESIVDFSKLAVVEEDVRLNAYCIEDHKVVEFTRSEIDINHFRASLSFPFIYPPYRIGGKHYYEGASYQTLDLLPPADEDDEGNRDRIDDWADVDSVVLFDVLTPELIHRPRDLWDAYAQSIIVPLVANAQSELVRFRRFIHRWGKRQGNAGKPAPRLYELKASVPRSMLPSLLTWSRSNLEELFRIGFEAGLQLAHQWDEDGTLRRLQERP
ncbi:MAG: patatin-like phospholipase family protein [Acetobacteraceae bacterium]|nr:patatin-like phospholipase family protein [Acetobacteraceae bacterium]